MKSSRRTLLRGSAAVAAVPLMSAAPAQATGKILRLDKKGQTVFRVLVGGQESVPVQHAARELAAWLGKVTGATFPVVEAESTFDYGQALIVGRNNPAAQRGVLTKGARAVIAADDRPTARDAFSLRTVGNAIAIIGANEAGTVHGVYWFLSEIVGIRWYAPDVTHVPHDQDLALADVRLNSDQQARFTYRSILVKDIDDAWSHRNLLNPRPEGMRAIIGSLEDESLLSDPEWRVGSRWWPGINPGQFREHISDQRLWYDNHVLFMDPRSAHAGAASLVPRIQKRIRDWGDPSHPYHIDDKYLLYGDPESEEFAGAHGGTYAAPVVHLVNETAREVRKVIPEARLETHAYLFTYKPPTGIKVDGNIVITAAPIFASLGDGLWEGVNDKLQWGHQLDGWCSATNEILLWDYGHTINDYLLPTADWWAHASTIKELAKRAEVEGYMIESSWAHKNTEAKMLQSWLIARMLWDPEQNVDQLIKEFVNAYYGTAGPQILELLQLLHDAAQASGLTIRCTGSTALNTKYVDWRTAQRCASLIERAEAVVGGDETSLKHVKMLRMSIDHLLLINVAEYTHRSAEAGAPWLIDKAATIARQDQNWDLVGYEGWKFSGGTKESLLVLYDSISTIAPPLPVELEGMDPNDYRIYEDALVSVVKSVKDPLATNGVAGWLPGNESWFVQLELSMLPDEGKWQVHYSARADLGDGHDPNAKLWVHGVYPPRQHGSYSDEKLLPLSIFAHDEYRTIDVDGVFEQEQTIRYIYLTGRDANQTQLKNVYVDRMWVTREK